jgi:serine/threonine protein phosphatase PrpC
MKFFPGNAQHIGARTEQQDSFGFSDPEDLRFVAHGGVLAVLADGAGGMEHGAAASRTAVQTVLQAYRQKKEHEEIEAALRRSLMEANTAVRALAEQASLPDNVATTLLAAVLHRDRLHWVSVGDSALYLYRAGSLSLLTESHTYAHELDREARLGHISNAAALQHPDREALTSYVGIRSLREINQSPEPFELKPRDKVLLSSDGLFKTLTTAEIADELGREPQESCDVLIKKTLEKNLKHQDNLTVLCIGTEEDEEENKPTRRLPPEHRGTNEKWSSWMNLLRHVAVIKRFS